MLQSMKKIFLCGLLAVAGAGLALHAQDKKPDAPAKTDPAVKPYTLDYCVFSGEKLTSMGGPEVMVYKGQEIKFCCSNCEDDFKKDPEAGMKKIMAALAKGSATTKPAGAN